MCTYLQIYLYVYTHTYIPTCLHTYIPTYLHTYIPAYLYNTIHPSFLRSFHTYIHTFIDAYIHTYIHTCMHARPTSAHSVAKVEAGGHCGTVCRGAARHPVCGPDKQRQGPQCPQGLCHQRRASTPAAHRLEARFVRLHQEPLFQAVPCPRYARMGMSAYATIIATSPCTTIEP